MKKIKSLLLLLLMLTSCSNNTSFSNSFLSNNTSSNTISNEIDTLKCYSLEELTRIKENDIVAVTMTNNFVELGSFTVKDDYVKKVYELINQKYTIYDTNNFNGELFARTIYEIWEKDAICICRRFILYSNKNGDYYFMYYNGYDEYYSNSIDQNIIYKFYNEIGYIS